MVKRRYKKKNHYLQNIIAILIFMISVFLYFTKPHTNTTDAFSTSISSMDTTNLQPTSYIQLSDLDDLGRCQKAEAIVGPDTLSTKERGSIGMIKPSGWHTVRYDDLIDDKYLYNRCHLLAYSLTGINADERNLITGTRYLNVEEMLPYEMQILNYIKNTGNHVKYVVTPVFEGNELVARSVNMQAYSIEDNGECINFHVNLDNIQPGITIDYATGESTRS